MKYLITMLIVILSIFKLSSQNNIIGSNVMLNATFHHISVHVDIAGDQNLDAKMMVEYKLVSEIEYKRAARTLRAHPDMIVDGQRLGRNHFAGSALFLEPNTSYNIRITLADPDNISATTFEEEVKTKAFPTIADSGNRKYVVPGNGGGNGTFDDPYGGLQYAADNAQAGDVIVAKPGVYQPFQIRNSGAPGLPISFVSEVLHQAIIDGNRTNRGIVTVGDFDIIVHDHIIDGFVIQNGKWGIDAQHTSFLTVQNNIIQDVNFGFVNRRESNNENDQYIFNNTFSGRTNWPQLNGEIPPDRAVDIRGNNHVVSYNTITDFADAVSCDGAPYASSFSLDIYNNEMSNMVDDFIEIDGNVSNTRVYNNRGYNGRMGVSVAPVFGGPVYVFRNVFYNLETSTFKMNRQPAGLIMVHNLGIKKGNGTSSDAGYQNTFIKNNIIMGSRYCFEEYGQINPQTEDWDYNAYYSTRSGTVGDEWFKWQNVRYPDIQSLAANTSIEQHGLAISLSDLNTVFMPQVYGITYSPNDQDHTPASGSILVDAGVNLVNINAPYVSDGHPDIGPYEQGQPIPQYGSSFDDVSAVLGEQYVDDISIFPNPTHGVVTFQNLPQRSSIRVFDAYGKLMQMGKIDKGSIDFSKMNDGIYWIEIFDNSNHTRAIKKLSVIK